MIQPVTTAGHRDMRDQTLLAGPRAPIGATARQMDLLRFVTGYIEAHDGIAPTMDDICLGLGLRSKSNASALIERLEVRGLIRRIPHRARSIEVLSAPGVPHAPDGAPLHFIRADRLARRNTCR